MYTTVSLYQLIALVAGNGSYIVRPCGHDLHGPTERKKEDGGKKKEDRGKEEKRWREGRKKIEGMKKEDGGKEDRKYCT